MAEETETKIIEFEVELEEDTESVYNTLVSELGKDVVTSTLSNTVDEVVEQNIFNLRAQKDEIKQRMEQQQ